MCSEEDIHMFSNCWACTWPNSIGYLYLLKYKTN
jgi:hypothetical protein